MRHGTKCAQLVAEQCAMQSYRTKHVAMSRSFDRQLLSKGARIIPLEMRAIHCMRCCVKCVQLVVEQCAMQSYRAKCIETSRSFDKQLLSKGVRTIPLEM